MGTRSAEGGEDTERNKALAAVRVNTGCGELGIRLKKTPVFMLRTSLLSTAAFSHQIKPLTLSHAQSLSSTFAQYRKLSSVPFRSCAVTLIKCLNEIEMAMHLPVLGNIKRPLKLQVLVLVVINKGRVGGIMATSEHSRRSILLSNCFCQHSPLCLLQFHLHFFS